MGFHLKDLPVYILLLAAIGFFVYLMIQSRKPDDEQKSNDTKKK